MTINQFYICNYKSIARIECSPSPKVNVLIGENSVGKSNIFNALNWLLGPVYPSFNSTCNQDHFRGDPDNKIKIGIKFSDGKSLKLHEDEGKLKCSGSYINDIERRRNYCSAYLGIDRQIVDYLPSNRWSLLGRILLQINEAFLLELHEKIDEDSGEVTSIKKSDHFKSEIQKIRDEVLFSVKDQAGNPLMQTFVATLQRESAKQLVSSPQFSTV